MTPRSLSVALALLLAVGAAVATNPQLLQVPTASSDDKATAAAVDSAGNLYAAGVLDAPSPSPTFGVAKFNSAGQLQWASRSTGPGYANGIVRAQPRLFFFLMCMCD